MPAYVINDMIGSEPAPFEEYKRLAPEEVVRFGGRYLVSGGHSEKLEGDWTPRRLVILEFPSLDQARAWIDSPDYAPARQLRMRSTVSNPVVVECVDPG
ncbi:MAG: DUF1330 domain-containing protein [Alphaproteobacteria bacterium]|nr:DUF1330 domain-containing protein [Alphaproteobacteria bacterium]